MPEKLNFFVEHQVAVGWGLLALGLLGIGASVWTQNTCLFLSSLVPITGGVWLVSD